jgi:hypothetical protein
LADDILELLTCHIWNESQNTPTYKILRFRFEGETTVVKAGLTLGEAQEHCQREDTHGDGWFDGYEEEA